MRYHEIISETVEDDKVFLAYCRKHKIKISDLSPEELSIRYHEALANRNAYPIPVNDPDFLYHGSKRGNLAKIKQQGLQPSEKTNTQQGNAALKQHSRGRVFFTNTIDNAEFYAGRAGAKHPVLLLRVRRDVLADKQPDSQDADSFYVERAIPPDQIEVWNGRTWVPLS